MRTAAALFTVLALAALAGLARAAEPEADRELAGDVQQASPGRRRLNLLPTVNCGNTLNCYACTATEAANCEWRAHGQLALALSRCPSANNGQAACRNRAITVRGLCADGIYEWQKCPQCVCGGASFIGRS
eukprot:tig00021070_g17857.t1